jgi:hypothetical protein
MNTELVEKAQNDQLEKYRYLVMGLMALSNLNK